MDATNPSKLFSVDGMVVVVTGGGTGIGLMMTKAFANNGAAKVYIVGRRKEKLEEATKVSPHGNIIPIVGDVTSKESLRQVADQIKEQSGYLNLACLNSGSMAPSINVRAGEVSVQEYAKKALEQNFDDWMTTFATNSVSVAFSAFTFLDLLDAGNRRNNCPGRRSQILVTTSIAGYLRLPANFSAYPASKAAATHIIKQLSGTLVPYDIRVNGIAPGFFPSDLAAGLIARGGSKKDDSTEEGAFDKNFIPAERLGNTQDMAGTVLYMASAAGAYLNGNITILDGGRVTLLPATY